VLSHGYAILSVKGLDDEARTIRGVATTPSPDRMGDVLNPLGATFQNPIPLLFHHDRERPVGWATLEPATAAGIAFTAVLPVIPDPGALRDRVNEAWHSLKAGLIRAVSVGIRVLELEGLAGGRHHLKKTEICELSLVTVPANLQATISQVKSLDEGYRAALGPESVSRAGDLRPGTTMTITEKIQNFENTRAAKVARMSAIMELAGAENTLEETQREEYDGLRDGVKSIDADLVRFREFETLNVKSAQPVTGITGGTPAAPARSAGVVSVRPEVEKGITFARSVKALLQANGDSYRALEYAKQYRDPNVELLIKAAVAPGSTTDPAWAGALVTVSNLKNEFVELSRPASILGNLNLRRVPFNVSMPIVTSGGTYKWVGQGKGKPVGKMQFSSVSIGMAKAAGIIVLTEELVRSSDPDAEAIVRDEMIKGIAQFLDQQFTDPTVAEVANVSPASVTNGAPTAASLDTPGQDLGIIISYFTTNLVPLSNVSIIMSENNAYAMGTTTNALGQTMFPNVGLKGGTAQGIKIVASNAVGDKVIGVAGDYVMLADSGGVSIDVSREATVQMNDTPVNPADPATTVWTSFFQDNLVGLRAERFINWKKIKNTACYYLTGAVYPVV
jgi:HK97 family phage major capsid protein/HK97 family phage prohead protease